MAFAGKKRENTGITPDFLVEGAEEELILKATSSPVTRSYCYNSMTVWIQFKRSILFKTLGVKKINTINLKRLSKKKRK